jgi:hypothetical protein
VRQLEVVAVSDDGDYVLLASTQGAAKPTHSIRIDGRLHAAVRGKLDNSERRESELSPKEIQARLRAGDSVEQVAKLANVPTSRVMRYAGPVISERERIVDQARAAVLHRPRGPESSIPLGEVVTKRLADTAGVRPDTIVWTARRRDDGGWVVAVTYQVARGGQRTASWLYQPTGRALTSLNPLATRLGLADPPAPPRRKRPAAAKRAATKRSPAKAVAAKRATPEERAAAAAKRMADNATASSDKSPAKAANGRVAVPSWSDVLIGVQAPAAARGRRRS